METLDLRKRVALIDEFDTANKLIRLGFGELQNINLDYNFYFLPFQLLSQGFERFMKAYICLGHFEKNKMLPNPKYLKKFGHDLEKLLDDIKQNYFNTSQKHPQTLIDFNFINDNPEIKELLFILSEFGKISRYYNFDFITGNTNIGINPKEYWQKLENKIMPIDEKLFEKLMNFDTDREVYQEITNHIIIIFEKFISSLSRQIIFGSIGQIGIQITINSFYEFGLIY